MVATVNILRVVRFLSMAGDRNTKALEFFYESRDGSFRLSVVLASVWNLACDFARHAEEEESLFLLSLYLWVYAYTSEEPQETSLDFSFVNCEYAEGITPLRNTDSNHCAQFSLLCAKFGLLELSSSRRRSPVAPSRLGVSIFLLVAE